MIHTIYFEFSATPTVEGNTLSGYAHTYNTRTVRNGTTMQFAPGAFDTAIGKSDPIAVINHNPSLLLGRVSSGTLRVGVDSKGLTYSIDLPDTTYANDLKTLVARGDITGMSFGVQLGDSHFTNDPDGTKVRTYTSVKLLLDISPVTVPAFTQGTSVALHSGDVYDDLRSQLIRIRYNVLKESR